MGRVLLVLPVLLFALGAAVVARDRGWRDGIVVSFVGVAALWWASAELLTPFRAFDRTGVALTYLVTLVLAGALVVRRPPPRPQLASWLRDPWVLVLLAELVVLVVIAVSVAPNNFDSMDYHLPKMEQWIQAEGVLPFRAAFAPQLYLPPLAEIGMAHLALLGGTVWAVNLVQLSAHVVALVGVSVIARNCGLDRRAQAIAAAVLGLAPLAVGEAVTTQNDYVLTALVVAAYAAASRHRVAPAHPAWLVVAALASGLAVSTKPTAVVFVVPALVWAWPHLRGLALARATIWMAVGAGLAIAVNVGWMVDNQEVFGSPSGPESSLTNGRVSADVVVGNLVRNAGHQLGTPVESVNLEVAGAIRSGLDVVGIDADDPDALYGSAVYSVDSQRNEDRPSNVLQGLLIAGSLVATLAMPALRRPLWPLVVAMGASYLVFAALFRWQVWGGRLLLPLLALGAVLVGAWVSRWPRWAAVAVLVALTLQSVPWLVLQSYRPLVGDGSVLVTTPEEELFAGRPELRAPYEELVAELAASPGTRLGLGPDMYPWEYPLWYLLHEADPTAVIGNVEGEGPDRPGGPWTREVRLDELLSSP